MGRKGEIKYSGRSVWVNQSTGEIREVDEFEKQVGRDEPFMITYLAEIINLIDTLGNKKMQVVKYVLKNMDKSSNTLIITTRELAAKCNVSKPIVLETLKLLESSGIVQRKTGAVMINPKLMNNKKAKGEAVMMTKYSQFAETEELGNEEKSVRQIEECPTSK